MKIDCSDEWWLAKLEEHLSIHRLNSGEISDE